MEKYREIPGDDGLSEDEIVDEELARASARHVVARIEKVMHGLAGVAENVIDDCDP